MLFGLAILHQEPPTEDLGALLPRMHPPSHGVWFSNPGKLTRDLCSAYPWAHVTTAQRAELRSAYAAVLRDRLALSEPPVAIRCPSGGCLLCGVASVDRAAIEVTRRGGPLATAQAVWLPISPSPTALGGSGPDLVKGHVCPACADAIDSAGAVGPTARGLAVVAHVGQSSEEKAERLRDRLGDDFPPVLPAWAALRDAEPSAEPWSHLRRVLDRLSEVAR